MLLAVAAPAVLALAAPADFRAEVNAADASYRPTLEANEALLNDGRLAEATKALLDLVPEEKRTAAHWFVLGNYLFQQDFAASYALHQKAFELAPDEPMTQYEWALERHRKREYAEAEALYAKIAAGPDGANDPRARSLRADCLLHVGRLAEAVEEWKKADPRRRHSTIEESFSWIYGDPHPLVERSKLLARARGGDLDAVESLVLLDLHWTTDWWNSRPNDECLAPDLALAAEKLGADSPRLRILKLLADVTAKDELTGTVDAPDEVATKLRDARVVGADVPLPASSRVASELIDRVETAKAATCAELLSWYEKPLLARAQSEAGDAHALELLAALYEEAGRKDQLAALEELGWAKHGAVACVLGVLGRKGTALRSDDPVLRAALEKSPADTKLCGLALQCAQRERKGEREAVAAFLMAHLSHMVSWNDGAQGGFLALEKLVAR